MYLDELKDIIEGKSNQSNLGKTLVVAKCLTTLSIDTGKFVAKNAPTVLGVAWKIRQELVEAIEHEYMLYKKEQKQHEFEENIKRILQKK